MNWFESMMLRIAGLDPNLIARAMPATAALLTQYKQSEPSIKRLQALAIEAQGLYAEAQPVIEKLKPLVPKAQSEIDAIMPAVMMVIRRFGDKHALGMTHAAAGAAVLEEFETRPDHI
jgi:hypothetical protein